MGLRGDVSRLFLHCNRQTCSQAATNISTEPRPVRLNPLGKSFSRITFSQEIQDGMGLGNSVCPNPSPPRIPWENLCLRLGRAEIFAALRFFGIIFRLRLGCVALYRGLAVVQACRPPASAKRRERSDGVPSATALRSTKFQTINRKPLPAGTGRGALRITAPRLLALRLDLNHPEEALGVRPRGRQHRDHLAGAGDGITETVPGAG
jgi:hypothetical protein